MVAEARSGSAGHDSGGVPAGQPAEPSHRDTAALPALLRGQGWGFGQPEMGGVVRKAALVAERVAGLPVTCVTHQLDRAEKTVGVLLVGSRTDVRHVALAVTTVTKGLLAKHGSPPEEGLTLRGGTGDVVAV